MAEITVLTSARESAEDGGFPFLAADALGDTFLNTGKEFVLLRNDSEDTAVVVTFVKTKTVEGLAIAPEPQTIAFGEQELFGPFKPGTYNDPETGLMTITYDGVDDLFIAIGRLGDL